MIELISYLTVVIAKDYKISLILLTSTVLSIAYFIYEDASGTIINLYTLCSFILLILFTLSITYRLRSVKKGLKELYFSLPFHREELYLAEVTASIIYSLIYNLIAVSPLLFNIPPLDLILYTFLPSLFLGVTIVNISDDRWRNSIQWLTAVFLLPFLAELSIYLFDNNVYNSIYWIFNLLPHEIFLSLNQIKASLTFLNIGFNILTYFIYLGLAIYIGIYIRERRDIL